MSLLEESILQVTDEVYGPKFKRLFELLEASQKDEKFIHYPSGLMQYTGFSRSKTHRLWNVKDFPRVEIEKEGVVMKGVRLSELIKWEIKNNKWK